ncbi:hypothetical protein BUALT_Bualt12G0056000 [Buddleja alternifolia]|uniref:F-box domain-containing protein n=1 Tax=Buddleja alternifolia TaxID=168488 RepID=A0AAV6WMV9_9LAMI|nr:hypothetical protein BUALT_Bualt12G0056000 [Buddleja alternifolia]
MMNSKISLSPSSAAIIGGNDDLLMQILLFLPAKSLIRFQSVCKQWQSLISVPSFYHLHTLRLCHRPKPQPSFLLRSTTSHFLYCSPNVKKLVPFRIKCPFVKILQCCNGLLLLEGKNTPHGGKHYYIYNPTTGKFRKLLTNNDDKKKTFRALCLLFDPSKSPHYEVVCFRIDNDSSWFEVYHSKSNSWIYKRRTSHVPPNHLCCGIYCHGNMYYIRPRSRRLCFVPYEYTLYCIDKIPRIRSPGTKKNYVMESSGHLHYIVQSLQEDENYLCVYEMDEDDFSWFIKYRVDLNPSLATFSRNNGKSISLLGIIRGEKEEDSILLFHVPGKIMLYRFFDEIFEVLVDFTKEMFYQEGILQFGSKDSYQFIETLVRV